MLPTDLAIFSEPSSSIPLCIQIRASGSRARPASAPPRSRGAGTRGRRRRRGCRTRRPAAPRPSPSTRCASPGARGPRRVPGRVLALLRRLPQREVQRIVLEIRALDALALVHLVDVAARELAVGVERADAEVHVAGRRVGRAALDQALDQLDDLARRTRSRTARRPAARARAGRYRRCSGAPSRPPAPPTAAPRPAPRRRSCR